MAAKIAVKKLTASDLTLFEWHFQNQNVGGQKSINLNADVFVNRLYPAIEDATRATGRLPLDLWVSGPGTAPLINFQRKIIKGGTYKNWRLDGEVIVNPIDASQRFNALRPGDFVVLAFEGDLVPVAATAVFVAGALPGDAAIYSALDALGFGGRTTMRALGESDLAAIVAQAGLPDNHPLVGMALTEEELEETAIGSASARGRGRMLRVSADAQRRAREAREENGRRGEELVAVYLQRQQRAAAIAGFEWVSQMYPFAPMDFRISPFMAPAELADVKSTSGPFDTVFHVSAAELTEMAAGGSLYRIYRVFELGETGAKLRISGDMKGKANSVLGALSTLPRDVAVNSVSMVPEVSMFGAEIALAIGDEEGEVEADGGRTDSGATAAQHEPDQGPQHEA